MYHLARGLAKKDIGQKGQCFRWKFYGETDELEDELSRYENGIAPILRKVVSSSRLSEEGVRALSFHAFVALQLAKSRTTRTNVGDE